MATGLLLTMPALSSPMGCSCGAAKDCATLPFMVDQDIRNETVRHRGSRTRNLPHMLPGLDMVMVLVEDTLVTE